MGPVMVELMHELTSAPSSTNRMSSDTDPCPGKSAPSLREASEATSGAANEGPVTIQGEELEVTEASEPRKATTGDECLRTVGEEEFVPFEQPKVIVPGKRDEDVNYEGSNSSQGEVSDERFEQPVTVAPDDMDGGVRDEGPTSLRERRLVLVSNLGQLLWV
ncbi:hypothetical protein AMTR_s00102p00137190 [Amborella trichopoda]|uniref:Uncharacterized protein n=1 Tax=Amborella trichopoda TaxID=13333 RepID=W1NZ31_AMBTC|nr:hypothetical protein AMTR_s00102p00137190 [Amborella trichopoda]